MGRPRYLIDTNVVSDAINNQPTVMANIRAHAQDTVCLCQPVYFEARRGLLWRGATTKLATLERLQLAFAWTPLIDDDWVQAALFWADTQRRGIQLSDVDLLIAALAVRLGAIIVSNDTDFDALPVTRHDWRIP